ncbi:hypothetical protein PVK06_041437 [Gossypium arboreum]|uniref:Uncharacterized protein n=1 Tax=Gossypium arboreum TaxID=29729 RepID=A0ABR0NAE1_GOSAR|nr:hypothetical protein PVK06_041437 [Gossypium arboreum]
METCEEVREKAEEALSTQMKLSAMWEIRARQKRWREKVAKSNAHTQGLSVAGRKAMHRESLLHAAVTLSVEKLQSS